eukprot:4628259-Alexandrium_andersonii.AAC.1
MCIRDRWASASTPAFASAASRGRSPRCARGSTTTGRWKDRGPRSGSASPWCGRSWRPWPGIIAGSGMPRSRAGTAR